MKDQQVRLRGVAGVRPVPGMAQQRRCQRPAVHRQIVRQQRHGLLPVTVQPNAGPVQRAQQRIQSIRVGPRPVRGHPQHLIGCVLPDIPAGGHAAPDAVRRGHRVPGFTGEETVDVPEPQMVDHLGRRQHHRGDVTVRVDAGAGQPVAQQQIVAGIRKHHRHNQRRLLFQFPLLDQLFKTGGAGAAARGALKLTVQGRGQSQAVAAQVQRIGCDQGFIQAAQPQRRRHHHGRQHMRAVELADDHLVADIRPGHLFLQGHVQALVPEKAQLSGGQQRQAVGERHIAQGEIGLHGSRVLCDFGASSPSTDTMSLATSTSFWLRSMASLRMAW